MWDTWISRIDSNCILNYVRGIEMIAMGENLNFAEILMGRERMDRSDQ